MNNASNAEEFERCILCGALTCIRVSMPIDWRENYEIGCGQLCSACAKKQSKAAEREKYARYRANPPFREAILKEAEKP